MPKNIKSPSNPAWHSMTTDFAFSSLSTRFDGLSQQEAELRLQQVGSNRLSPVARGTVFKRFFRQFHNVLIYLLLLAAAITYVIGETIDSLVIGGVVVINTFIGFIQEGKAEKALDGIRQLLTLQAKVRRNGIETVVSAESLAPGDLVILESGDKIPADLRLIQCKTLRIDEALLTGESLPVEKTADPLAEDSTLAERCNMAYSGTLVTFGTGRGIVVATGDNTEIGRINKLLGTVTPLVTPLLRQIGGLSRWLSLVILLVAAGTFAYGWSIEHSPPTQLFLSVVSLAVAAIPEGLPAIMTITLAVGVQLMARQNAIIRRLPAVETLGSVTVICTDKTGTLTCNEMTVKSVIAGTDSFAVEGAGYDPNRGKITFEGAPASLSNYPDLKRLVTVAALCNNAAVKQQDGNWICQGDPTEAALITLAMKANPQIVAMKQHFTRSDDIPFESAYGLMATLHHNGESVFVFVKGAPEKVLNRCEFQQIRDLIVPIDHNAIQQQVNSLANSGQRLLAVAIKMLPQRQDQIDFSDIDSGLTLLGVVGMIDPPRPEAVEAVRRCQAAGIRVKMVTGDHAATASAIARQMSIGDGSVLLGDELEQLTEDELEQAVRTVDVFARATPENKIRLVRVLQKQNQIVAMTGDGVNDAPAIKSADVGIAMGKKGTDVAKEASEIVLADDNFASIANAVEVGRGVYDNLKKAIIYILPTSFAEAMMIVVATLTGNILPITPVQILWINMLTETTLSLTLAFEHPEQNVMARPPRKADEPLLSGFLVWRILLVSLAMVGGTYGLFLWVQSQSDSIPLARTVSVNTLVMFEIVYLFNSRYLLQSVCSIRGLFGNKFIWLAIIILLIAQLALTYFPPMQRIFATEAISWSIWQLILGVSASLFFIIELEKWLIRCFAAPKPKTLHSV